LRSAAPRVVSLLGFHIAISRSLPAGPRSGSAAAHSTRCGRIAVIREMGPLITAVTSPTSARVCRREINDAGHRGTECSKHWAGAGPISSSARAGALIVTPLLTAFNILMSLFAAW
jgi:hypothetical protein